MKFSKRTERNERLGAALRRGDPASAEADLAPEEAQAMRRAVLLAVPETEPRRTFRLAPALAAGAVAVLSLVVALSLWRMHGATPVPPALPDRAPAVSAPAVPPAFPSPDAVAVVSPPPPVPLAPARRRQSERRPRMTARPAVPVPAQEPAPETTTPMRQVQFSTAGGTRIIWLLPAR